MFQSIAQSVTWSSKQFNIDENRWIHSQNGKNMDTVQNAVKTKLMGKIKIVAQKNKRDI
jgi:argininosuccinate synthase